MKRRGLTIVEVVVVVAIIAIVLVVILSLVLGRKTGCGLGDSNQIKQIHMAFLIWSRDHAGLLPTPGRVGLPFRDESDEDHSLNHTANVYSMIIAQEYFNPDLVISPNEVNPVVSMKKDYDWNVYRPHEESFWDMSFVARLDDPSIGSNTSYAHLAICGDRQTIHWRDTQDANMPIIGTRGTRDGVTSGPEYDRSPTLRLHGMQRTWEGNIVFNDNSVRRLDSFTRPETVFDDGSGPKPDNMYRAEFSHPKGNHAAADAFLGIFIEASKYSVVPVFDALE